MTQDSPDSFEDFPMKVVIEDDESMSIFWDPDHPVTSVFNTWSSEDFLSSILNYCEEIFKENGE